eukprot:2861719-Pyramimonas_sp.AAC.1
MADRPLGVVHRLRPEELRQWRPIERGRPRAGPSQPGQRRHVGHLARASANDLLGSPRREVPQPNDLTSWDLEGIEPRHVQPCPAQPKAAGLRWAAAQIPGPLTHQDAARGLPARLHHLLRDEPPRQCRGPGARKLGGVQDPGVPRGRAW